MNLDDEGIAFVLIPGDLDQFGCDVKSEDTVAGLSCALVESLLLADFTASVARNIIPVIAFLTYSDYPVSAQRSAVGPIPRQCVAIADTADIAGPA